MLGPLTFLLYHDNGMGGPPKVYGLGLRAYDDRSFSKQGALRTVGIFRDHMTVLILGYMKALLRDTHTTKHTVSEAVRLIYRKFSSDANAPRPFWGLGTRDHAWMRPSNP